MANVSNSETILNEKLRKQLVNGLKKDNNEGILRERDIHGNLVVPFTHQRSAVYEMVRCKDAFLLAHAMGLGKTLTCIFAIAAHKLVYNRIPKTVIACPSSLLTYWRDTILNHLRIHPDLVLFVDKASKISNSSISNATIIVISRDVVSSVFGKSFHKVKSLVPIQTRVGMRWANTYIRTPGTKLHPLFGTSTVVDPLDQEDEAAEKDDNDDEDDEEENDTDEEAVAVAEEGGANGDDAAVEAVLGAQLDQPDQPVQPVVQYKDSLNTFDLLICDEAHGFCNPTRKRSKAFRYFSKLSKKRFAVTGTPIRNRQEDIASICSALRFPKTPIDFGCPENWSYHNDSRSLNEHTNLKFAKYVSRVGESDIELPQMTKTAINFDPMLQPNIALVYNEAISRAKNLRLQIQHAQDNGFAKLALAQLISLIQKLSFLVTCPLLAEYGVEDVNKDPDLVQRAVDNPSNAMFSLINELRSIQNAGHDRIVVAGVHISLLKIVSMFIGREAPDLGTHFHFNGSLSNKQKDEVKHNFLNCKVGLLFLGVRSGGQGLHLVPGCQAMVLFGAAPWSAAECDQLFKRIHRLGQDKPVSIYYMVAHGSVDASIYGIHGCKRRLEKMTVSMWQDATEIRAKRMEKRGLKRLGFKTTQSQNKNGPGGAGSSASHAQANQDDDEDLEDEEDDDDDGEKTGKQWRRAARIVDALLKVDDYTGSFPPMPERVFSREGVDLGAFTLVPGVVTRGLCDDVPEDAVPLANEVEEQGPVEEGGPVEEQGPVEEGVQPLPDENVAVN